MHAIAVSHRGHDDLGAILVLRALEFRARRSWKVVADRYDAIMGQPPVQAIPALEIAHIFGARSEGGEAFCCPSRARQRTG